MIIKVSFIIVASVAALKISQTKSSSSTKRKGSDGSHLEQEYEDRENSIVDANHGIQNEEKEINFGMPKNLLARELKDLELLLSGEEMHNITKKELLQNLVQNYKKREVNLERKLLELKGLREEKSAIVQMQKQLEEKTEKADFLKKTIASLQSESKIIREKIREDLMSRKQLDIAKKMINEMQRKKGVNASPVREQMLILQQQVTEFGKYSSSGTNAIGNKKLKEVKDMEVQVLELKRRNKELELDKREMGIKLASAQARVRTEEEIETRIKEEITGLRHVHEELSEQVERLQRNRFHMVQEVVYQRWLYTLLMFEIQDHQKQSRKASIIDNNQNSSKELLCEKKRASTSDFELESVSSDATLDESDEIETTTFESSSSSHSSCGSMKMKRWRKTKDYYNKIGSKAVTFFNRPGLVRRFSMSNVASDASKSGNNDNSRIINLSQKMNSTSFRSLESPMISKKKRVSFSDSVKLSTYEDMPTETVENAIYEKETWSEKIMELTSSDVSSTNIGSIEEDEVAKNKIGQSDEMYSNFVSSTNIDSIVKNEDSNNRIGHSDEVYPRNIFVSRKDERFRIILVQLTAFFLFSLILLAYFRIK